MQPPELLCLPKYLELYPYMVEMCLDDTWHNTQVNTAAGQDVTSYELTEKEVVHQIYHDHHPTHVEVGETGQRVAYAFAYSSRSFLMVHALHSSIMRR